MKESEKEKETFIFRDPGTGQACLTPTVGMESVGNGFKPFRLDLV